MSGFAIQKEAFYSFDTIDLEKLNHIRKRREALNQWRINAVNQFDFLDGQNEAPESYYEDLIQFGERGAINVLLKSGQSK